LFKVEKPTPRSSATWRRESPLVSAIRTASLRNSSVLPVPMVHPLCCTICDQRSGTKPGQVQYAYELSLEGLRVWPLRRFPYLIFYIEQPNALDVWRVLHGQRDIPSWMQSSE
jgi:hypothetical protein